MKKIILAWLVLLSAHIFSNAAIITVTNNLDAGAGSLRNALGAAAAGDVIQFNIAGAGPHVITLASALHFTTTNVTIDATTEPDYTCGNPAIVIDAFGLWPRFMNITGSNNTIRGISFRYCVLRIDGGDNNQIYGCWFNLNNTGLAVSGDNSEANHFILTNTATGNTIGGTACNERNVFSDGGATDTWQGFVKIQMGSNNNIFRGNYFGSDKNGTAVLNQNSDHVFWINGCQNITIDQNVIIGANVAGAIGGAAIYVDGANASGLTITANKIGVDVNGNDGGATFGNAYGGIVNNATTCNTLTITGNVICRNGLAPGADIHKCGIFTASASNPVNISNNYVGVTSLYAVAGNQFAGVFINGTCSNITINNNVIGGNGFLAGDESHGLSIEQACTTVSITNNYVGISPNNTDIGNACSGITISGGSGYTVTGNIVGFNDGRRTTIPNANLVVTGTANMTIQNNRLGITTTGANAGQQNIGGNANGGMGIFISGATAQRIRIGGMGANEQNIIAFNAKNGIHLQNADFVEMRWNSIFCNGADGIEINCGTAQQANGGYGCAGFTITTFTPPVSSISGTRPTGGTVDVFGTYACASGACTKQSQYRYSSGVYGGAGTAWNYNHGSNMTDDISALVTGSGTDCNTGFCRTSEFTNCVDNPLPVSLLSFEGVRIDKNTVTLYWETAMEINNAYFIIERSSDGENFEAVGTVKGAGTIKEKQQYVFTDNNAAGYLFYYRLKQVDNNGSFANSPVIAIKDESVEGISIYPNPNNGNFTIRIYGMESTYSYALIDDIGQIVLQKESAENLASVDGSNLSPGIYLFKAEVNGILFTEKIIIQ
ncbi:MAG: T9SS type A sorting domain-containing protein [Cytophagaceae bacterium]|nr:T9SS type A sorting domain-containing protein [Cytophagaceae bacterium]